MYRPEEIKTGLFGLWGWRQNYNVSDFTIAPSLTTSETGQFYQEVHPLLTLDNIKSIAPEFEAIVYPTWAAGTQYYIGDRVATGGTNYRAKRDNLGADPASSPSDWEPFDAFSEWLENKTQASILKAIRSFWDEKMTEKTAKNILESKALFDGTGRIYDTIEGDGNLVGFELVPIRSKGVTTKINKIGLQFQGVGNFKAYLMHSSRAGFVKELSFIRTKDGSMEWFTPTEDIYLPYLSDENDAGGSWYLVYKQSDLLPGVVAINTDKDWSKGPCGSCNRGEQANYRIWSRYLEVHPFKVNEGAIPAFAGDFDGDFSDDYDSDPVRMWDIEDNIYTYETNYGINLQLTIECDTTDIILEQKKAFQNIIGMQVAIDMLREFTYNPAFNIGREQQNFSRQEILYELDGDSQGYKKSGLVHDFTKAMKAIKLDTTSMSRVCFPCNNKGVKFRTV